MLKGKHNDRIDALIISSYLWSYFEVLTLSINMRLMKNSGSMQTVQELAEFDKWLFTVGDGSCGYTGDDDLIQIPPDMVVQPSFDPRQSIVHATFLDLLTRFSDRKYDSVIGNTLKSRQF